MTVVALSLLFASGTAPPGPTPQEFAKVLAEHTGAHVKATDLRHLSCKDFGADEPTEASCRWQQRVGRKWKRYSVYVAADGSGWHLIDEPNAVP